MVWASALKSKVLSVLGKLKGRKRAYCLHIEYQLTLLTVQ